MIKCRGLPSRPLTWHAALVRGRWTRQRRSTPPPHEERSQSICVHWHTSLHLSRSPAVFFLHPHHILKRYLFLKLQRSPITLPNFFCFISSLHSSPVSSTMTPFSCFVATSPACTDVLTLVLKKSKVTMAMQKQWAGAESQQDAGPTKHRRVNINYF